MSTPLNTHHSGRALFKRLLREHVWRYRMKLLRAACCMVIAASMTASNAYMMQPMLDKVFIEKDQNALFFIPLIVFAIAVINAFAQYGQGLTMRFIGQRIISDMQVRLFGHLIASDLRMFHDQASGRLISRFTNDIQMMRQAVSTGLVVFIREITSVVFLVGVMVYQSWELTLIAMAVFPIAIYPMMRLSKRMRKVADGTQQELGEFTAQLDEVFQGARTVKAYNREAYEAGRAYTIIEGLFALYYKASRIQAAAAPMMEILSGIAIASVIGYGGSQVVAGATTPGAFFSFITAFIMAYRPVKALAGFNTTMQEGLAAANRYFNVLDTPPVIQDKPGATALKLSRAAIELRDVSFSYTGNGDGVSHVSINIQPGQKVALVGHSGGGKSTLFNLILRFYDVQGGSVIIDGQDIRDVTQHSLRDAIAFVSQDTVLFDDTIYNNIAYGRESATEAEIKAAALGAHAAEFIERLPEGYNTRVGANGVRLSGGQRQRIAIARAMVRAAPILLLDEATSALDNTSERAVQQALASLMENRTTVMIAHRLSTIMGADVIHVIERGRVIESGSHEQLLAAKGAYFRLYAQHYAAGAA